MESKKSRKKVIPLLFIILVLIILVIGGTYAVFYYGYAQKGQVKNLVSTRAINCTFNEGTPITIQSAFPISDEIGKKLTTSSIEGYDQGYYDATLSCECKGTCKGTYEIYAVNTSKKPRLDESYVKVYLTNGEGVERQLQPVTNFSSLKTSKTDSNGKVLYQGDFSSSFSRKIRLRLWISKDYPVGENSLTFSAKLNAKVSE